MNPKDICQNWGWRREQHKPKTAHGPSRRGGWSKETTFMVKTVPQHVDLFMIGHAASENDRKGMIAWLKKYFPNTRILALNPPRLSVLAGADYNVKLNRPEAWLSVVSTTLGSG